MNHNLNQQPVEYRPAVLPEKRGCGCFGSLLLIGFMLFVLLLFGAVTAVGVYIYVDWTRQVEDEMVALDTVRDRETFETTEILDRSGNLLWEIFGEGKRTKIPLSEISKKLYPIAIIRCCELTQSNKMLAMICVLIVKL